MRQLSMLCISLSIAAAGVPSAAQNAASTGVQPVAVSFSEAQSAKPLDGRLLFLISKDPSDEPRMQIDDTPRSQMVFGMTVDGVKPGESVTLAADAAGYPVRRLRDVPEGDYTVQAVLNIYETFHRADGHTIKLAPDRGEGQHWNLAPGNLYSKPMKVHIGPKSAALKLTLDPGDSADCAGAGHEVHPAHQDSIGAAVEVLGQADVLIGGGAGAEGV